MCTSERENVASDNEMKIAADEPPSNVQKVGASDNTENNNIDKAANQIEASVDSMGDKFNLDEVMMGDAPIASPEMDDTKPIKSTKKITPGKQMKNRPKQMRKLKNGNRDEIMMGDQPAGALPTQEALSHVKNVISENMGKQVEIVSTPKTMEDIQQTTIEIRSRRETENPAKLNVSATTTESNVNSETDTLHAKGSHKEISRDHFIPPMLLVQHQNSTAETEKTTTLVVNATIETPLEGTQTSSTQQSPVPTTILNDVTTISSSNETSASMLTTIVSVPTLTQETTTLSTTIHAQIPHEYVKTNMMRPHAPKFGGEISYHAPSMPISTKATIDSAQLNQSTPTSESEFSTESSIFAENITSSAEAGSSTVKPTEQGIETTQTITESTTITDTELPHLEVAKRSNIAKNADNHQHKPEQQHKTNPHKQTEDTNDKLADFTNSNVDYQPYKPNRKRILTKPETHTYIQKIFG